MSKSTIEWTEATWNPLTGCNKVSPGCKHCYAERLAKRLKAMGQEHYSNGFQLTLHDDALTIPLKWKKPRMIFVNSMSDLFHEAVPLSFIERVFTIMNQANWHTYQILTKRADRLLAIHEQLLWRPHIWMGVSVENQRYMHRIEALRYIGSHIKFLSLEPLLGPLPGLDLTNINWVIVGGESGPGARPIKEKWIVDIRNVCQHSNVPFFFKQWGGVNKKKAGRVLEGQTWNEMPQSLVEGIAAR